MGGILKSITYIHDFCFRLNGNDIYTAVGMPENYFDRFFDVGFETVFLISRNKKESIDSILSGGFDKIHTKNIVMPVKIENYLSLIKPNILVDIIFTIRNSDLLVINFPSVIGLFVWFLNLFIKKDYTLEVAADYDQFSSKKFSILLTLAIKVLFSTIVKKSKGVIFVSKYLCQKYKHLNSIVASNVNIDNVYQEKSLVEPLIKKSIVIITMAGGVNKRKGVDVAIEAMLQLKNEGLNNVFLNIAGGHFDDDYSSFVGNVGLNDNVVFHGLLKKEALHKLYSRTDIYIQPSRAEGIPRATIEAMSFGLPIVATELPGFKEILSKNCLVLPGSSKELAKIIKMFLFDVNFYNSNSERNIDVAKDYLCVNLRNRRARFYETVLWWKNERI